MYNRTKYCCAAKVAQGTGAVAGAVKESMRISAQRCTPMVVTTVTSDCSGTVVSQVSIPIVPGADVPYVPIQNTPASVTLNALKNSLLTTVSDPYNPATRFSQYFPPQPPGYDPPVPLPNNYPREPMNLCGPNRVFTGSTKK